jgi:hypothetical protein
MNWLKDNPIAMALVSFGGVLVLLALGMAIVWSMPVSVETGGTVTDESDSAGGVVVARQAVEMSELQIVNERPVFNESRLPVIAEVDDEQEPEETTIAITGAPDVKLTGVIITPDMKIATLTPAKQELENIMAHEGQSLTGEFVGWHVGTVNPRTVVLKSSDGQQLKLELQVHDMTIKEPPKPVPAVAAAQAGSSQEGQAVGEDGQPLSRADQIRQRIAERREELRLEQKGNQAQEQGQKGDRTAGRSRYQDAISEMMQKRNKEQGSDDEKDG